MSSLPATPGARLVSFDHRAPEPAPSLDRSIDLHNLSSLAIKRAVREFTMEFSELPKLMSCSSIYLPQQRQWNRCESPLCWACSRQRANRASRELRDLAVNYPSLATMTLSIQSTPEDSLSDLWDSLDGLRADFIGGRWLSSRVAAVADRSNLLRAAKFLLRLAGVASRVRQGAGPARRGRRVSRMEARPAGPQHPQRAGGRGRSRGPWRGVPQPDRGH